MPWHSGRKGFLHGSWSVKADHSKLFKLFKRSSEATGLGPPLRRFRVPFKRPFLGLSSGWSRHLKGHFRSFQIQMAGAMAEGCAAHAIQCLLDLLHGIGEVSNLQHNGHDVALRDLSTQPRKRPFERESGLKSTRSRCMRPVTSSSAESSPPMSTSKMSNMRNLSDMSLEGLQKIQRGLEEAPRRLLPAWP